MARVTMSTVAERAGVSKNTVSLALRRDPQIPATTRERIEKIARDLGYAKNPVVSQLMTELRKAQPAGHRRTLALLNAHPDPKAFTRHPTIPAYVTGCRRRAALHGYALDVFWLADPQLYGERLNRVLKARAIHGLLVVGLMKENRLPTRFSVTWQNHPVVVTGVRTHGPSLSFASVDHHELVLEAMEHARQLGYSRPALVIERGIDELVDGRFSAGFWTAQRKLPAPAQTLPFFEVESARADPGLFHAWFSRQRPDIILTLHTVVREWLEAIDLRVPRDVGLVQLERRRGCEDWAGMDQHNDLTGEAAVDLLLSFIHGGAPDAPRATLVSASWSDGSTTRPR